MDLARIAGADWIVEAVVEQIDVKRSLLERVEAARRPGTIVTSNTSGIPLVALAAGRGDDFRRHWLGTHFFNPPRYLRLLEIIPTPETDPGVVDRVSRFADVDLGKGIVVARDTPGFIANRIGLFGIIQALRALESGDYTIEEIDAITGPALGRPKSATFRTMDIAGIDVIGHVTRNLSERLEDDAARQAFAMPPLVQQLIDRGWIGEKSGQGFYKREKTADGIRDPDARSGDLGVSPRNGPRVFRRWRRPAESRTAARVFARCFSVRTRSARFFGTRSAARCSTPRASRRRSRTR